MQALTRDQVNELAITNLKRTAGVFEDFSEQFVHPPPQPPREPEPEAVPLWCRCGRCREMARDVEKKCCRRANMQCHSLSAQFQHLCLDLAVLDIVCHNLQNQYARAADRGNRSYRYASYHTYVVRPLAARQIGRWQLKSGSLLFCLGH